MLLLDNNDVAQVLDMQSCIQLLEEAVRAGEAGDTVARPATSVVMPKKQASGFPGAYKLETRDGISRPKKMAALRIMSDNLLFEKSHGSLRRRKIPAAPGQRYVGLILLFDTDTSELAAIIPDAEIQRRRVAATGALVSKYVARADAHSLAMIGSGWQAESAVLAHCLVRDISRIRVFSPNRDHREAFCAKMRDRIACPIEPVTAAVDALRGSDQVVAVTDAVGSVIDGNLLESGTHITLVRPFELDEAGYRRCNLIIESGRPQNGDPSYWSKQIHTNRFYMDDQDKEEGGNLAFGEWVTKGGYFPQSQARRVPLPDIVLGQRSGRERDDEISCFFISTPSGPHLAYLGALVVEEARRSGFGRELPSEWFSEKEKD